MKIQVFSIFVVLLLILSIPSVSAQEINIAQKGHQKSVEVKINDLGNVHVKHVVSFSNIPNQIDLIDGTINNLVIIDEEGKEQIVTKISGTNSVMILPSNSDSIIEYDLGDVLVFQDEMWVWDFTYLQSTSFIFPDEVNLIFVDERPILLDDKKGIKCHGCQMILEYSFTEPKIFEKIVWEDREFLVELQSHSNIDNFVFDQPSKSISFNVNDENKFVTTIIPLELLWEPYTIFLDDDKIAFHKFLSNSTHIGFSVKPENSGEISIIGTTVIPEFPIIAPLAIGFLMILILPFIKKFNLH